VLNHCYRSDSLLNSLLQYEFVSSAIMLCDNVYVSSYHHMTWLILNQRCDADVGNNFVVMPISTKTLRHLNMHNRRSSFNNNDNFSYYPVIIISSNNHVNFFWANYLCCNWVFGWFYVDNYLLVGHRQTVLILVLTSTIYFWTILITIEPENINKRVSVHIINWVY